MIVFRGTQNEMVCKIPAMTMGFQAQNITNKEGKFEAIC